LSDDKFKAIARSRMDPRHAHLDALLDPELPARTEHSQLSSNPNSVDA